jgi:hypothetical protein
MALFIRQDDQRSELQQRLASELREKAKARAENDKDLPDGVDDSNYLKDTKPTTRLAWVWMAIIFIAIFAGLFIFIISNS